MFFIQLKMGGKVGIKTVENQLSTTPELQDAVTIERRGALIGGVESGTNQS
jgi:hypothetical protein